MTEAYPSDNSLLNLASENETGVEYIETGKAPYYLEFRKLLYRLLLVARRANDLRVFDEGGLDIGVKAGEFWGGANLREYAGSSGNTLADDKANIYIYLDSNGNLIVNEYSGFPDSSTNHIRLAVITTSGGDITNIDDRRGQHLFNSFAPALANSVIKEAALGSETAGGITTGALACRRIASSELEALLDTSTNNLFSVNTGDRPVLIELMVKTAAGAACTVDIGFDSDADGSAADTDGWIVDADANVAGFYSSNDATYDGAYVLEGKAAAAAGNVTITSSSDQSGGSFVGQAIMWYIPA